MSGKRKEAPQLTKAEETVMKALWQHNSAFVKEIIAAMPAPKLHANTVNTVLKILAEKGFVTSEPIGNAKRYTASIPREAYSKRTINQLVKGYFNNSFSDMVSFFVTEKSMDVKDLEDILQAFKNSKK